LVGVVPHFSSNVLRLFRYSDISFRVASVVAAQGSGAGFTKGELLDNAELLYKIDVEKTPPPGRSTEFSEALGVWAM
jgi:hypothetical protein